MPREALRPEMKDALAQLAKFDSGMAHVEVLVFVPGPYGVEPQKIVNGALPYFEVAAEDLKDFERWVLQHPSLGGGRNYRCKITVPNAKGNYAPRPDRVVELNFAGPTDTALGAMAQVPALAQAAAQGIAEQADFYNGKAAAAAQLSTTKAAESAALTETDPKRSRELADQAEAAAREAKQHADAAGQQMANLGQVLANLNRTQTQQQQTPIGQPNWVFANPQQPYAPQPYYPQAPQYFPPQGNPYGYPQAPAAPASDPMLVTLVTKLMERLDRNDVPARPAGPPPELVAMQQQMNAMQGALAEAKAQAAQAKADADRARDKAESDAKMAELRAEMARMRDGGDSRKPDATLELAKIQMENARTQAEAQGKMYELLQRTTDASNARLIEILQSGGDDDYAVKAKALMSMQGEIFQSGMQMMQMASKLGGAPEGGGKLPAWVDVAQKMLGQFQNMGNAMMANPQGALDQARATGSLQPPPVVQQQQMPPPPAQQPAPIPPGVAVPPPAQVATPRPTREQYVAGARAVLQKDDIRQAFAIMKEGLALYPDLRAAGEDDLAAAQRLFDGAWPPTATEERVGQAVVELYGAGILPRLMELSQATANRAAANDDVEGANSDRETTGPNGVAAPAAPRPVHVVPPPAS